MLFLLLCQLEGHLCCKINIENKNLYDLNQFFTKYLEKIYKTISKIPKLKNIKLYYKFLKIFKYESEL